MESEKERTEAILRGTGARYGFARLDDGREVFVPPDEMLKAFPGDRVQICVRPSKDKRPVAEIERLVNSPLGEFTGQCVTKGKALFVKPDLADMQRWLFLPPKARNGVKDGDYIRCEVARHPIKDGKPQARIVEIIGSPDDPGIENRYTMAKHGLQAEWPADALSSLESLFESTDPLADPGREDFSDLPFVSIDASRTQDIDDALYAEVTSSGWLLYVAIADPTAYIKADSELRSILRERASSVYFHGTVVPMLPESLAQQRCALAEDELRPALVCRVAVPEAGQLGEFSFCEAKMRSRAKLSYFAVDRYLGGQDDSLICHATPLEALYQVSRALRSHREAQELVMEDRQEYRWHLNDSGHIENIEPGEKLSSQRLVEECMVAANRCAGRFLQDHGTTGPYVVHDGFRRDRLKDRTRFVELYAPELKERDLDSLEGYRDLLRNLAKQDHELPLRSMVNRLLTRARLSKKPGNHMGMTLPVYSNCTSPLRKYLDLLVHLQIKAVLRDEQTSLFDQPDLDHLSQRLGKLRITTQEAERWLAIEYLQRLSAHSKDSWPGHVTHMANNGFTVRLGANGLEGFVDLRNEREKFHFDKWTATLGSKTRSFRVGTAVQVRLAGVDEDTPHLALFSLAPESGLKTPPAADKATPDEPAQKSEPTSELESAPMSDPEPEPEPEPKSEPESEPEPAPEAEPAAEAKDPIGAGAESTDSA